MKKELIAILAYNHWRHRVSLGKGLWTHGYNTIDREWERNYLPENFKGKSFLDVGANDGYFSFEAEKRGAKYVNAIDIYSGGSETMVDGWDITGITLLKNYFNSKVEIESRSVYDLTQTNKNWDTVFCSDVLSWLEEIPKAVEQLATVCNEKLYIKDTFNMVNETASLKPHNHGTGFIYRMNIKYLEEQLLKNGFKIEKVKPLYTFEQYEWQAKNFPSVNSSKNVAVYEYPGSTTVIAETQINGDWKLSEFEDYIFVRNVGWVKKSDVVQTPRYSNNPLKSNLKKLLPKSFKEGKLKKTNIEQNIAELLVIAKKL